MTKRSTALTAFMSLAVIGGGALLLPHARAGDMGGMGGMKMPATMPSTMPTTAPAVAINKLCPVTKEAVDPSAGTYEYKGKVIGFCCPDCVKTFKADPEKYMADLK